MTTPTRAAIAGTVTALVVVLRIAAVLLETAGSVARRIADTIAAGRAPKTAPPSVPTLQLFP